MGPKHFPSLVFTAGGQRLELAERYTYLGCVFIPSGAVYAAADELAAKCSRAWFSISNILYENKKMSVQRCLKLVDSLVFPVGLYASEFLAPLGLSKTSFKSEDELLRSWENYKPELTNQRVCRLVLSVQKKTSRLAVLGELGRYPVLLQAIQQSLMYEWSIRKYQPDSLVGQAVSEMEGLGQDTWLSRVQSIRKLLDIPLPPLYFTEDMVRSNVCKKLKSKFDVFYLREMNRVKIGNDGINHNKLRLYSTFKGTFKPEYYIDNINNRNQRAWISRLRTSSHRLEVEVGRYTGVPLEQRQCRYCSPAWDDPHDRIGDEAHFLHDCPTFAN